MSEVATLHAARIKRLITDWLHLSALPGIMLQPARERGRREGGKKGERGCHFLSLDVEGHKFFLGYTLPMGGTGAPGVNPEGKCKRNENRECGETRC